MCMKANWSFTSISLPVQQPAASRWPNNIFDMRIEILDPKNLHLDIYEGTLDVNLYFCIWVLCLQDQPPMASRWTNIFLMLELKPNP